MIGQVWAIARTSCQGLNYKHLKLESINNALNIIRPNNVCKASTDLKDAFFSVPIHSTHQKYIKFTFDDFNLYACQMDMDLLWGSLLKYIKYPLDIWEVWVTTVVYVEVSYLQGKTYQAFLDNISGAIKLLNELHFVINTEKSVLTPSQTNVFLGFIISSKTWCCH